MPRWTKDLNVTLRGMTRTTERAAHRRGVGYFLPALFVDRFSHMGGIDRGVFERQLAGCRSFEDEPWTNYWRAFADEQIKSAGVCLVRMGGPTTAELLDRGNDEVVDRLRNLLSPVARLFADRTRRSAAAFVADHPDDADAVTAVDALVKAITYLFAAAWPGWTSRRLAAYADSRRVFDVLVTALAPALGVEVEKFVLDIGDDAVSGCAILPAHVEKAPAILITNGLEGTIEEIALPAMHHRPPDTALFLMEMPGTFSYRQPMSTKSERHYRAVIDHMATHPRVDAERLGMMGISFGAHWSTRMAWRDNRLKAVVSNGGPYHRAFAPTASFGMAEIMTSTLEKTTGAKNPLDLGRRLKTLSLREHYREISVPILATNGDSDTLVPTQDTVDLAYGAPRGELKLYPHDDHCAMGHYDQTMAEATSWLQHQLGARGHAPRRGRSKSAS